MPEHETTRKIAYLGPHGTFTEEALLTQSDLSEDTLVPLSTIPAVLAATSGGRIDLGFVAIENSIEGTVRPTIDTLVFEADLLIQREVEIDISLNLLGLPGAKLEEVKQVMSYPVALSQCRGFLGRHLPDATDIAANSTAHAARRLSESGDMRTAAVGTALAADVFGLEVLADHIEDHADNRTRFVLVSPSGIPAPTGHDKTSLVVFQRANEPGSLLAILQEFAARGIDLVKLESRPSKRRLGEYCFLIDVVGHIASEVLADAVRELKITQYDVKFLGSYPAAGTKTAAVRRDNEAAWAEADNWMKALRSAVGDGVTPL